MSIDNTLEVQMNRKSKKYEGQYGKYIDIAATAMQKKYEYEWTPNDSIAFGQYADTWLEYRPLFEADNTSRNSLGGAIEANLGLVAMAYSALPIQNLASVQPLNDEVGTVFFRKAIATRDRGDVKKGDLLLSEMGGVNSNIDTYTSETQIVSSTYADNTTASLVDGEIRPGSVRVSVAAGKIKGMDDGEGHIIGAYIDGAKSTIDYVTGAVDITFLDATTAGVTPTDTVDITYMQSTIDSDTVSGMKWILERKPVAAQYFLLQSEYSNLSELVLRKRFGAELSDQVAADLVSQVTSSILNQAIKRLRAAAIRNEVTLGTTITFPKVAGAGISDFDHRRTFDDKIVEAVDAMYLLAKKGEATTIVVGVEGKKILRSCGMRIVKSAVSGPHLCGMYDDIPVYYAPNTVLGSNEILIVYRGANWYEAPLVYAPFLPVTTVAGTSVSQVMMNAQAVYHAAAVDNVIDGFVIRITIQ